MIKRRSWSSAAGLSHSLQHILTSKLLKGRERTFLLPVKE